jgi:enterochelin esterase-like enzyme
MKTEVTRGIVPTSAFARWVTETEKSSDASDRVKKYLSEHPTSPVLEGNRIAHILYSGPENEIVLRGDLFEIGDEILMHRVAGTDLRYASLELEPDARVTYQFIRNVEDPIADPRNSVKGESLNYPGEVSVLTMPEAKALVTQPTPTNLCGRIVELELESPQVTAEHLKWGGKRAIKVYLPADYDKSTDRYPSVYVLYGDEMTKSAQLPTLLDQEIGKSLPPLIAVFVASTSPYELARTFREPHLKMIANQLVPKIDGQFRTITEPAKRIILGTDEGGYAAVEIGLRNPHAFGGIVAHSIFSMTGGDQELLALIDHSPKNNQRFYVDWGRYDPRRKVDSLDVAGFSRSVADRLKATGKNVQTHEWNEGSLIPSLGPRALLGIQRMNISVD